MAVGSNTPSWDQFRNLVLLAESSRILHETVSQCVDRLTQFEDEFKIELNKNAASLLKCSLWTQSHLDYTDARFSGVLSEATFADARAAAVLEDLESILQELVQQTNTILGVCVRTLVDPHLHHSAKDCGDKMTLAADLARRKKEQLVTLQSRAREVMATTAATLDDLRRDFDFIFHLPTKGAKP